MANMRNVIANATVRALKYIVFRLIFFRNFSIVRTPTRSLKELRTLYGNGNAEEFQLFFRKAKPAGMLRGGEGRSRSAAGGIRCERDAADVGCTRDAMGLALAR